MAKGKTLTVYLAVDSRQASRNVETFGGKLKGLGKVLAAAGIAAAVYGLSKAISAAVDVMGESIGMASDLAENLSKVGVVFGDGAAQIEEWSTTTANAFGVSRNAALTAAGDFGTFAKAAGLAGDDAAAFAIEMTELAGDLASFQNISVDEALSKLSAGLRGESEPLRSLGVLLDAATLKTRAFEMGLIDTTTKALTPQQKVLAAHAEILAQTTDAQGDAARTGDEFAGSQRRLTAQLDDLKTQIGSALLPVAQALVTTIVDDILPAFQAWWDEHGPKVIEAGEELARWITSELLPALGRMWETMERDLFPVLEELWEIFGEIFEVLSDFTNSLGDNGEASNETGDSLSWLSGIVQGLGYYVGWLATLWKALAKAIRIMIGWWEILWKAIQVVWDWVQNLYNAFVGFIRYLTSLYTEMWNLGRNIIEGLLNGLRAAWDTLSTWWNNSVGGLISGAKSILGIQSPSRVFAKIGGDVVEGFRIGLSGLDSVTAETQTRLEEFAAAAETRLDTMAAAAQSALDDARDAMRSYRDEIDGAISSDLSLSQAFADAASAETDWWTEFVKQSAQAVDFGQFLEELTDTGASQALVDQVAAMGPAAGSALAQELLDRGLIPEANRLIRQTDIFSRDTAKYISQQFYGPGIDAAKEMFDGLATAIRMEQKRLERLGEKMGVAISVGMSRSISSALSRISASNARSGVAANSPVVLQVDGRTLGTVMVEQLQTYTTTNGAIRGVRLAS